MKKSKNNLGDDVRMRLVEVGGRTSQDLGMGRIVGQILVYLYLWDGECSLNQIEKDLGLSKAAVSTSARQLESMGLLRRVWKKGDRKNYYRTADNIGMALQQGLLSLLRTKIEAAAVELDQVCGALDDRTRGGNEDAQIRFLADRVKRAKVLRDRAAKLLGSPLLRLLVPSK